MEKKISMTFRRYTVGEELANTLSHGTGILLGMIAAYFLLTKAFVSVEPRWAVASVCVYLFGMLASYITSTCYHACFPGKKKELLRKFDHGAIYLHIAGTYTPVTLVTMRHASGWGWGIFGFVWLAVAFGLLLSFIRLKEHSHLETVCYIVMGIAIVVAIKPFADCLAARGSMAVLWWLIGGGISYIIGAAFYSFRKPYMHFVFHLFCLGGSVAHILAIYKLL